MESHIFRNQNIDHAAQIAFTSRFGEVTYAHPHEDEPIEGFAEILPIDRSRYERKTVCVVPVMKTVGTLM